jgi:hypothetical protein
VNAQLKAIVDTVIARPEYDNHFLGYEADWVTANLPMLRKWWDTLNAVAGEEPDESFDVFCLCQHDIQLSLRDGYRNTLRME